MEQFVCENLSIGYDGVAVQTGIDISIEKGDYLCIVGKNGAGKSTFVKTVLGLISPVSGRVRIGEELESTDIGYIPQQTQIQKDFPASVWEVVLSGCINKHKMRCFYSKAEKELAKDMLEKVGMIHIRKKTYSKLSGGQQQRVLLARALCATSKILLLDEPVAGLDPNATAEMYELIKKLNEEGVTIIMITHDVENGVNHADYVLSLDEKVHVLEKNQYFSMLKGGKNE